MTLLKSCVQLEASPNFSIHRFKENNESKSITAVLQKMREIVIRLLEDKGNVLFTDLTIQEVKIKAEAKLKEWERINPHLVSLKVLRILGNEGLIEEATAIDGFRKFFRNISTCSDLLSLPVELLKLLEPYLPPSAIAALKSTSHRYRGTVQILWTYKAERFGYRHEDPEAPDLYLKRSFETLSLLFSSSGPWENPRLKSRYSICKLDRCAAKRKIDLEGTLNLLKKCTAEDMIVLFSKEALKAKFSDALGEIADILAKLHRKPSLVISSQKDYQFLSPIAFFGNTRILRFLLDYGFGKNEETWKSAFLIKAIGKSNLEMAQLLLEVGAKMDFIYRSIHQDQYFCHTALTTAVSTGELSNVAWVISRGANVNFQNGHGDSALSIAAALGRDEIAQFLIQKGASVDTRNRYRETPLHNAAGKGHLKVVKTLIQAKANYSLKNRLKETPFVLAAKSNQIEVVAYLIQYEKFPKQVESVADSGDLVQHRLPAFALHAAAQQGHLRIIKMLVAAGFSLSQKDAFGDTPLSKAVKEGKKEAVSLILELSAQDYREDAQAFALHASVRNGNYTISNLLLRIDPNKVGQKNRNGWTPLMLASREGSESMMKLILAYSPDLNEVNQDGDSALHIAVKGGRKKATKILLQVKADAALTNIRGETPASLAVTSGNPQLAGLFKRRNILESINMIWTNFSF